MGNARKWEQVPGGPGQAPEVSKEPHLSPPDQPFPEALRRHSAELRESMSALEYALAAPAIAGQARWVQRVHVALVELSGDFRAHVDITEGPDGLYRDLLKTSPRLSDAVASRRRRARVAAGGSGSSRRQATHQARRWSSSRRAGVQSSSAATWRSSSPSSTSRAPKASGWSARSTPRRSGSRTSTSRGGRRLTSTSDPRERDRPSGRRSTNEACA